VKCPRPSTNALLLRSLSEENCICNAILAVAQYCVWCNRWNRSQPPCVQNRTSNSTSGICPVAALKIPVIRFAQKMLRQRWENIYRVKIRLLKYTPWPHPSGPISSAFLPLRNSNDPTHVQGVPAGTKCM
jgi:hypothetical protein